VAAGEMKSRASRRFWDRFHALPTPVQTLAVKNYQLWLKDPAHPSLHFHRLRCSQDRYAVRVGDHHRALGHVVPGSITRVWIGTHEEYNRLTREQ
jgi:hypothetical protein